NIIGARSFNLSPLGASKEQACCPDYSHTQIPPFCSLNVLHQMRRAVDNPTARVDRNCQRSPPLMWARIKYLRGSGGICPGTPQQPSALDESALGSLRRP